MTYEFQYTAANTKLHQREQIFLTRESRRRASQIFFAAQFSPNLHIPNLDPSTEKRCQSESPAFCAVRGNPRVQNVTWPSSLSLFPSCRDIFTWSRILEDLCTAKPKKSYPNIKMKEEDARSEASAVDTTNSRIFGVDSYRRFGSDDRDSSSCCCCCDCRREVRTKPTTRATAQQQQQQQQQQMGKSQRINSNMKQKINEAAATIQQNQKRQQQQRCCDETT